MSIAVPGYMLDYVRIHVRFFKDICWIGHVYYTGVTMPISYILYPIEEDMPL